MRPLERTGTALLDPRGRIAWLSPAEHPEAVGHPAWERVAKQDQKRVQAAVAMALVGEHSELEIQGEGGLYRCRYKPVPVLQDVAVCVTFVPLDPQWARLTAREKDYALAFAAAGTTEGAAELMGVSVSTANTHRRRISNKAGLQNPAEFVLWCSHHAG